MMMVLLDTLDMPIMPTLDDTTDTEECQPFPDNARGSSPFMDDSITVRHKRKGRPRSSRRAYGSAVGRKLRRGRKSPHQLTEVRDNQRFTHPGRGDQKNRKVMLDYSMDTSSTYWSKDDSSSTREVISFPARKKARSVGLKPQSENVPMRRGAQDYADLIKSAMEAALSDNMDHMTDDGSSPPIAPLSATLDPSTVRKGCSLRQLRTSNKRFRDADMDVLMEETSSFLTSMRIDDKDSTEFSIGTMQQLRRFSSEAA